MNPKSTGAVPCGNHLPSAHIDSQQKRVVHSQNRKINQAELSSAVTFLLGDAALTEACALLMAQTDELFGSFNSNNASEDCSNIADENSVNDNLVVPVTLGVSTTESSEERVKEKKQKRLQQYNNKEDFSTKNLDFLGDFPKDNYAIKLTALYQQCKEAHEVITRANELGMLSIDSNLIVGNPSSSSSSSLLNNYSMPASRSVVVGGGAGNNNTPGVTLHSMPQPPLAHVVMSGSSIPSMINRNRNGTNGKITVSNIRLNNGNNSSSKLLRKKTFLEGGTSRKLQRYPSDSDTTPSTADAGNSADPPPAVMNFLKKLNSVNSGDIGSEGVIIEKNQEVRRKAVPSHSSRVTTPVKKQKTCALPPLFNDPSSPTTITQDRSYVKHFIPRTRALPKKDIESISPGSQPSIEQRSMRSSSKPHKSFPKEKTYEIGESVLVNINGENIAAIVKNVFYGDDVVTIDDKRKETYEVELDDGNIITEIKGEDLYENEDD